jgi:hypothetical protein
MGELGFEPADEVRGVKLPALAVEQLTPLKINVSEIIYIF